MSFDAPEDANSGISSKSSSSTQNTTYSTPITLQDVQGTTIAGNSNSPITFTDQGTVAAAFGFAEHVAKGAFDMTTSSQIDTAKTVTNALNEIGDAYETAKAGEQKIFAGAALAVVGLVAVVILRKGS